MTSYSSLEQALGRAATNVDRARQNLYYCDVSFAQRSTRSLRHDVHAATYVYVAAAVESYISQVLDAMIVEINAQNIPLRNLRLSLFSVVHGPHLEALQAVRGFKMWGRRIEIFEEVNSTGFCQLDAAHIPLDGRTIRPSHLETIWNVLGLEGDSTPGPLHRLALTTLADNRNSVAHGEEDAGVVAGKMSIQDTLRLLDKIDDIIIHIHVSLESYLNRKLFLR